MTKVHVTEIVNSLFPYRDVSGKADFLMRGRLVHRYFLAGIQGLYTPAPKHVEVIVQALLEWWSYSSLIFESCETEVTINHSMDLTIVGTLDLLVWLGGKLHVVDLKVSSALSWQAVVQANFYGWLTGLDVTIIRINPKSLMVTANRIDIDRSVVEAALTLYSRKEIGS